jgi:hypothetical protein
MINEINSTQQKLEMVYIENSSAGSHFKKDRQIY